MIIQENPVHLSANLRGKIDKGLGIQVGYGDMCLSLSKNMGGERTDQIFSVDFQSAGYALQAQYFSYTNPVNYHQKLGDEETWIIRDVETMTEKPGQLRSLLVDAFYAFNRRTFAYSAAYRGNLFQKRSAGSWMFGSKVILGEYRIDPEEEVAHWVNGQARQTTEQVSMGGGYSYNLVPFHRQPYAERDKDVRNGRLQVNYVARIGIGYSYNLFSVNLSASNNDYSYRGISSLTYGGFVSDNVETKGSFFRWTTTLRLGMRF